MYRSNNYYMSANPFSVSPGVPQSVTVFKNPYQLSMIKSKTQKKSKSNRQYASQKVHTARSIKPKSVTRKKSKTKKQIRVLSAKQSPTKKSSSKSIKYIKSPKSLGISPFTMKKNYHTSSTRKINQASNPIKPIVKPTTNTIEHNILSPLSSLMNQFTVNVANDNISNDNISHEYQPRIKTKSKRKSSHRKKKSDKTEYQLDLSPLSSILTKYKNDQKKQSLSKAQSRKKNYHHSEKHSYAQYSVSTKKKHSSKNSDSNTFRVRTSTKSQRKSNGNSYDYSKIKSAKKTSMVSMYNNKNEKKSNQHNRSKSDPWNVASLSLNDIKIKSMLGEGAFSKVYLVKFNQTKKVENNIDTKLQNQNLALKVIEKKKTNKNSQQHTNAFEWERFALSQLSHPFIIDYYGSFFDDNKLCILTQFVIGGEILYHFENSKLGRFDNFTTQFYIAEIMCALEYLHSKKYVYRDLKPENILIDRYGHIKLVDFGFAKRLGKSNNQRTYTLCGSKEYVAPEVLIGNGHSFEADFWSLGVLTYEFAVGFLPFPTQECDPYQVLPIMQQTKIEYPNYVSRYCVDFIKKLLVFDPKHRMTSFKHLKNHIWFQSNHFDWQLCNKKGLKPPILPHYASVDDASNYATARFDIQPQQTNNQQTYQHQIDPIQDLIDF